MRRKIEALETVAREMVGDAKAPNLFFVTEQGVVTTITRDFDVAYQIWRGLPISNKPMIEDRQNGVLCSIENWGGKTVRLDDSHIHNPRRQQA